MKKLIILIMIIFLGNLSPAVHASSRNVNSYCEISPIDNGWYKASVKYYNYNTSTRGNYTLNVKVEYDRVVEIDFGEGGSVHTGFNNSNYTYSGGYLSLNKNYDGEIISASGKVTIRYTNGNTVTFDIEI